MSESKKPVIPSDMPKDKVPYILTSSQTVRHLAKEAVAREGIKPITYKYDQLSDELKKLVKKVWELDPLTDDELDKIPYEEYARYILDPRRAFSKPEALDGLRVLEVCRPDWFNFALQYCGSLLGELGAEVIKIEDPYWGDAMRRTGPPIEQCGAMKVDGESWPPNGTSLCGFCETRNKYCTTLDITTETGRDMFRRLAATADVIIENYDPGFLDSLGIGYRQLREVNPRLVYCAITPYGQWGEDAWRRPFETGVQALSTLSSISGPIDYKAESLEEAQKHAVPTRIGWNIGDIAGGITSAFAVMAGLVFRERKSGKGQMIDVSSEGLIIRSCDCSFDWYSLTGKIRGAMGNWDLTICPYGLHPCKGGRYSVVAGMGRLWWAICDEIAGTCGADEAEVLKIAFADNPVRVEWSPQQQINTSIDKWTEQHEMNELMQLGIKGGFAAGGVYNIKEICDHDHFLDRGAIMEVEDPLYGRFLFQGPKPVFSETPGRIKWVSRPMGWDNELVFSKHLGLGRDDLKELEAKKVIGPRGGWGPEQKRPSQRRKVRAAKGKAATESD
ncbi:MAG: CoA transferase, partial [Chloroflexi bacterium]|nr:CoA transferase [Chloroflexota bacterium]